MIPVFDGHNDTLLALLEAPDRDFVDAGGVGHIDVTRAKAGGLAGGLFAMFAPDRGGLAGLAPKVRGHDRPPYGSIDQQQALHRTLQMFALLRRLEKAGHLRVCISADEVEAAMAGNVLAAVPHIEGAEAILDVDVLEALHGLGLRSLGLVWSRPNAYGTGVPFAFPASPDVGPGLTSPGLALVEACDALRIVVDVSHLNEAGFWDVARTSTRPFVASHSNVHALCESTRNLTDKQLDAIAERDGLVGLNFAVAFLREDGGRDPDVPLEVLVRHLDYMVEKVGEDRVGLGSDFDGAIMPTDIGDAGGLQALVNALSTHSWNDTLLEKVMHGNWLALLRRVQEA